jgi:hypothetical protein
LELGLSADSLLKFNPIYVNGPMKAAQPVKTITAPQFIMALILAATLAGCAKPNSSEIEITNSTTTEAGLQAGNNSMVFIPAGKTKSLSVPKGVELTLTVGQSKGTFGLDSFPEVPAIEAAVHRVNIKSPEFVEVDCELTVRNQGNVTQNFGMARVSAAGTNAPDAEDLPRITAVNGEELAPEDRAEMVRNMVIFQKGKDAAQTIWAINLMTGQRTAITERTSRRINLGVSLVNMSAAK